MKMELATPLSASMCVLTATRVFENSLSSIKEFRHVCFHDAEQNYTFQWNVDMSHKIYLLTCRQPLYDIIH